MKTDETGPEPAVPARVDAHALRFPGEARMLRRTLGALALLYLIFTGLTLSVFFFWMIAALLTVRVLRTRYRAHALEVSPGQFPHLHELVERCATRLGTRPPRLYLSADPGNWPVFTVPMPEPAIVMSSWWAKHLTPRELEFFVYHELAHGVLGHRWVLNPINVLENVGAVSWILATPLEIARYALRPWTRLADFSADRVAIACMDGDLDTVATALAKITAGDELCDEVEGAAFLEQARRVDMGWAMYLHEITSGRLGNARRLSTIETFTRTRVFAERVKGELPPAPRSWVARLPVLGPLLAGDPPAPPTPPPPA